MLSYTHCMNNWDSNKMKAEDSASQSKDSVNQPKAEDSSSNTGQGQQPRPNYIEIEGQEYRLRYIVIQAAKWKVLDSLFDYTSNKWVEAQSTYKFFDSKQAAIDHYRSGNHEIDMEYVYMFAIATDDMFAIATDEDGNVYDSAVFARDLDLYIKLEDQAKQQTKPYQHNDSLLIEEAELLNQPPPIEEDCSASQTLFVQPNQIIQVSNPAQLLVLWKKYRNDIIKCCEDSEIENIARHVHETFFIRSSIFAVEIYALADVNAKDELWKDLVLLTCVRLEKKIINKKLYNHSRQFKNSKITTAGAVELLKTLRWRKALKQELIVKRCPAPKVQKPSKSFLP